MWITLPVKVPNLATVEDRTDFVDLAKIVAVESGEQPNRDKPGGKEPWVKLWFSDPKANPQAFAEYDGENARRILLHFSAMALRTRLIMKATLERFEREGYTFSLATQEFHER